MISEYSYGNQVEIPGANEFMPGKTNEYFVSKNPSTAAGSYLPGGMYNVQGFINGGGTA
jgi:hypothetical protein